jgi:hypothetical protein
MRRTNALSASTLLQPLPYCTSLSLHTHNGPGSGGMRPRKNLVIGRAPNLLGWKQCGAIANSHQLPHPIGNPFYLTDAKYLNIILAALLIDGENSQSHTDDPWLTRTAGAEVLKPAPEDYLRAATASPKINAVRNQGAELGPRSREADEGPRPG